MKFKDFPFVVRLAVALTFFNTWVMFEEFVIDRFGLWQYLPFYKKVIFCAWYVSFILLITALLFVSWQNIKSKCFILNCVICK